MVWVPSPILETIRLDNNKDPLQVQWLGFLMKTVSTKMNELGIKGRGRIKSKEFRRALGKKFPSHAPFE